MTRGAAAGDPAGDLVAALEADLAALAAADSDLERDAEVAERTRIERTSITLADRLRGATGPVELVTAGGGRTAGAVVEVGDGWVLVASGSSHPGAMEHLVALGGVTTVRGLGRAVVPSGPWTGRSLSSVLRAWCRDRSVVNARLVDGTVVQGRASAAYADHLEVTAAGGSLAVALPALAVVSR